MSTLLNDATPPPEKASAESSRRSSDGEGTVVGEPVRCEENSNLSVHPTNDSKHFENGHPHKSPSQTREESSRFEDDLEMLRAERIVSDRNVQGDSDGLEPSRSRSMHRSRSHRSDPVDEFDVATNPIHEKAAIYKLPEHPSTNFARFVKKIHGSSFLVRYFTYIIPPVLVILLPLLLGVFLFPKASVGGVRLMWFCIWLEIVWLTLWLGRIIAKALPHPIGLISSLFTNNSKKWRDLGKQLEIPATMFFWWLAVEISFLPTMNNHHVDGNKRTLQWEITVNKIIISVFVGVILNFCEKIIIQLIAISFHLRTYADRIDINKFQIGSLTKLYSFSKGKIAMDDSEFEEAQTAPSSGARTPMAYINIAQKKGREAVTKVGDVAGKVAGDFAGRAAVQSTHPHQVVLTLLSTTAGSQVLARRLYRTFAREETETVFSDDLKDAFDNEEEAEAAFQMFDKDLNGDISMEELEAVCAEIGRERKSITASLKDLDSVVSKLNDVLVFAICIVTLLVFLSLISTSAAGVLTSAGSTILALSWLFSATAQEFLQSCIFVFVKHPFDVGDRVSIYGNTGANLKGDDYMVKEIALLYTEFKKLEGHVVQAPNSYLNTLFVLNQRRSGGLAEAIPIVMKFGTTMDQMDALRIRMLEFVTAEKREYQPQILTELREVLEAHSITMNVVFFYKSNWQNELLRIQRRNKFMCTLMVTMQDLGIEGPRMRYPGQKEASPVYLQNLPSTATTTTPHSDNGPLGQDPPAESEHGAAPSMRSQQSILRRRGLGRGDGPAAMSRRVDFSLGMRDIAAGNFLGDIDEERPKPRIPVRSLSSSSRRRSSRDNQESFDLARTTSRDAAGYELDSRTSLDSQSRLKSTHSVHRNRFFGRLQRSSSIDLGEDLECGTLADIPERPLRPSARIDPRTGLISPQAVCSNSRNEIPLAGRGVSLEQVASQGNGVVESEVSTGCVNPADGTSRNAETFEMGRLGS